MVGKGGLGIGEMEEGVDEVLFDKDLVNYLGQSLLIQLMGSVR